MVDNFCKLCNFDKYPECIICNIINSVSLENLLTNKNLIKNPFLVCKYNAQNFNGKEMQISKLCPNCNLCKIICKFGNKNLIVDEDLLFSELPRLNIYFSNLFTEYQIATEVTVNGNSRKKRLDLVIKRKDKIILIKVLSNIDKYGYYYRSYTETMDELIDEFKNFNFEYKCLVKKSVANKCNELKYKNAITVNGLINIMKEG